MVKFNFQGKIKKCKSDQKVKMVEELLLVENQLHLMRKFGI